MLKNRLIPCLLLKEGRCVKTVQFGEMRDTGSPVTAARVYDAQQADELIFLDINASKEGRSSLLDVVGRVAEECFMPLTAGGGIHTLQHIRDLLKVGADKVAVNTAAVERPDFINEAADRFGNQCIIIAIDVKKEQEKYTVYTHSGTQRTELDVIAWAREAERRGAGELLINSIDRDGMMKGYDIPLIHAVTQAVSIPVIALGGVGTLADLAAGLRDGKASAVAAASIFHFGTYSITDVQNALREAGLPARQT